jgi:hypothetical protein
MGEPLRFIPLSDGESGKPRLCHARDRECCVSDARARRYIAKPNGIHRHCLVSFVQKLATHCNVAYCLMGFVDEFEDCALKPAHRAR